MCAIGLSPRCHSARSRSAANSGVSPVIDGIRGAGSVKCCSTASNSSTAMRASPRAARWCLFELFDALRKLTAASGTPSSSGSLKKCGATPRASASFFWLSLDGALRPCSYPASADNESPHACASSARVIMR